MPRKKKTETPVEVTEEVKVEETPVEVTEEVKVEETPEVTEEFKMESELPPTTSNTGAVTCEKLFVRSKPSKSGSFVAVIIKGTEIEIDHSGSTSDFYRVKVGDKYGYCAKEFIKII